jgi:hypothetical protein
MKRMCWTLPALSGLLGAAALPAAAQVRKPDPKAIEVENLEIPNIELFKKVYQSAGTPNILVICGLDRRPFTVNPRAEAAKGEGPQVIGKVGGDRFVGKDISLFDPAGEAKLLKAGIEENLLKNAAVDLVSTDALAEVDRREIEILRLNNEFAAIKLLGTKVNADLVILINMLNTGYVRQRGPMYRVTVEIIDAPRARKIGVFGFDWTEGLDAYTVKRYAGAVTRKIVEQLAAFYGTGDGPSRRYTVRLVGLADIGQMIKARQAFEKVPGVQGIRDGGFTKSAGTSIATLTVTYAGRPLDLLYYVQENAAEKLGFKIDGTDGTSGTITLIAKPLVAKGQKTRAMVLSDENDPEHRAALDTLLQKYGESGRPKIGVLINRSLTDDERNRPEYLREIERLRAARLPAGADPKAGLPPAGVYVSVTNVTGGNLIIPTGVDGQPLFRSDDPLLTVLDTRRMEDLLYKRLVKAGLTMVDPNVARKKIADKADRARILFEDSELVYLLGAEAGVDYVVQGVGRIDRARDGRSPAVSYTFRVVRVNDGVTIGAEGWSSDLAWGGAQETGKTAEAVSNHVAGNLLDQMMTFWTPPRTLTVVVNNARTQRDVFTIMNAFRDGIPGITAVDFEKHEGGKDTGLGIFSIRYMTNYDDLVKRISEQEKKLPFTLEVAGTSRDTLNIRMKEGL